MLQIICILILNFSCYNNYAAMFTKMILGNIISHREKLMKTTAIQTTIPLYTNNLT